MSPPKLPRGFVLGKFMPPHNGHVLLCDFARNYVDDLTILVCSLPTDPIPGALRFAWMRDLFPRCRVLWMEELLPQAPEDDPINFWSIWRDVVLRHHPEPIDAVFASEPYGARLADEVGAQFIPCDIQRAAVPISGTAIRRDPFAHWRHLPDVVRPNFVKRVCIFGPESSGKTTLANALGAHLRTSVVPEYGRLYTEMFGLDVTGNDLTAIARGQAAAATAAKRHANRILIEDTDPLLTSVWSQMLLNTPRPDLVDSSAPADLYLLCGVEFPWVDDGTRYFSQAADRKRFHQFCEAALQHRGARYVHIGGTPDERVQHALRAIEMLLLAPP